MHRLYLPSFHKHTELQGNEEKERARGQDNRPAVII